MTKFHQIYQEGHKTINNSDLPASSHAIFNKGVARQRAREKEYREKRKAMKLEANGGKTVKKKICPHCGAEFTPTSKASFIDDARIAAEAGCDVMIVKGWEGGGHVTFGATTVLVPQAVNLLDIPVVASGGLADGRGFAAAVAMGAEGFEMGTAFMAANENAVHPNVKKAVIEAGDMSTVITG